MTATLYVVRHGQTDWNAEGRLQGHRDTHLNSTGLRQAEEAAGRLRGLLGEAVATTDFLASPLTRTRQTVEHLRRVLDLPPDVYRTDPRLMEIGFGAWEGSTWAEIRRRDPAGAGARDRDRWGYQPPGEGAESYTMLTARVSALLAELDRTTVLVAHGGIARAVLVARGLIGTYAAPRLGVRQGQVLVVEAGDWRWA